MTSHLWRIAFMLPHIVAIGNEKLCWSNCGIWRVIDWDKCSGISRLCVKGWCCAGTTCLGKGSLISSYNTRTLLRQSLVTRPCSSLTTKFTVKRKRISSYHLHYHGVIPTWASRKGTRNNKRKERCRVRSFGWNHQHDKIKGADEIMLPQWYTQNMTFGASTLSSISVTVYRVTAPPRLPREQSTHVTRRHRVILSTRLPEAALELIATNYQDFSQHR